MLSDKTRVIKSSVVLIGLFMVYFLPQIKQLLGFSFPRISDNNYIQLVFIRLLYYSPMILLVLVVFRKEFVRLSGLHHAPLIPFGYALLSCLPLFILYPIFFGIMDPVDSFEIYNKAIVSPFFEELIFRALFFGTLYGLLGWKFWQVVVINALVFSAGHLYQAQDPVGILLTVLVTSVACVWWGWLYIRWAYSIWFPVFLHVLMNFAFEFFQVSGGAAMGGVITYVARLLVIGISVWLTLKYTGKMERLSKSQSSVKGLSDADIFAAQG